MPVLLVRLQWNLNFMYRFSKNIKLSNYTKIRPVEAELFHVGRPRNMTKLIVAFRNFQKSAKQNSYQQTCKYHRHHLWSACHWGQRERGFCNGVRCYLNSVTLCKLYVVRLQAITSVASWDMTPCTLLPRYESFRAACCIRPVG